MESRKLKDYEAIMQTCDAVAVQQVFARCLIRFLKGRRLENNPLTLHELKQTQMFGRCSPEEQAALRFAVEHTPRHAEVPTAYDSGMVRQRDEYLMWFSAGASAAVLNQHRN
jgi:hypothetical protein